MKQVPLFSPRNIINVNFHFPLSETAAIVHASMPDCKSKIITQ